MKREILITAVIVVSCFLAGIFLSNTIHSKKSQGEALPPDIFPAKINTPDLIGRPLPDFSLMDVSGQLRSVSEWQGKVLVINFWATWCPPCLEEIPHFVKLQKEYDYQGLQFVGIALESVDEVLSFASEQEINYPLLVGEQEVIKLAEKLGNHLGGLPYTVIFDRDGRISFIKQGPLTQLETEQNIIPLLPISGSKVLP